MRRVLIAAAGVAAATALLLSLKSKPGVTRLPDEVPVVQRVTPSAPADPPDTGGGEPGPSPDPGEPVGSESPDGTVYTGDSAYTEFGYVTVQITVLDGRIVDVTAIEMPTNEPRSAALSERAAPILRERALAAQSADFDTVSGATWTSEAYRQSLQSALRKAGGT